MGLFNIIIDGKNYDYIDSINYENENYVAYSDEDSIYISKYTMHDEEIEFMDIDEDTFNKIREVMQL